MAKRALTNISNIRAVNENIGPKRGRKRLKESPENVSVAFVKKSKNINKDNDEENHTETAITCINDLTHDPTRTIEKRLIAIDINCKGNDNANADLQPQQTPENNKQSACDGNILDFTDPHTYYVKPGNLPQNVEDFDKTQIKMIESEPHYAYDIFEYYKQKEIIHAIKKYMTNQPELSTGMRSVLIDWMVEVQESFELNHETLYLAVKLVDNYLMHDKVVKSKLQLIGATAMLIAAKFDERIPPAIEDFLYICDDAYKRRDIILTEMKMLRSVKFYLGFPISYRFLRRFARCSKLEMETLTLARYILEISLMEYDLIEERDSLMAAASLLLALKMKGIGQWTDTLRFYTGYEETELTTVMYRLNDLISNVSPKTKTIKTKYSHRIFFEVAKIVPLPKNSSD